MLIHCILCYNHFKTLDSMRGYRWIASWTDRWMCLCPPIVKIRPFFKALDFDRYEWLLICPIFSIKQTYFQFCVISGG